jgi:hypothetical protein
MNQVVDDSGSADQITKRKIVWCLSVKESYILRQPEGITVKGILFLVEKIFPVCVACVLLLRTLYHHHALNLNLSLKTGLATSIPNLCKYQSLDCLTDQ